MLKIMILGRFPNLKGSTNRSLNLHFPAKNISKSPVFSRAERPRADLVPHDPPTPPQLEFLLDFFDFGRIFRWVLDDLLRIPCRFKMDLGTISGRIYRCWFLYFLVVFLFGLFGMILYEPANVMNCG